MAVMSKPKAVVLTALVAFLIIPLIAQAVVVKVRPDSITGRVFETSTNSGVPGLSVRLVAPRAERLPTRITATTSDGRFEFVELRKGKYLLVIYQGTTLLFRREIDTSVETEFTVALRPGN
jgi:hypothetical protein